MELAASLNTIRYRHMTNTFAAMICCSLHISYISYLYVDMNVSNRDIFAVNCHVYRVSLLSIIQTLLFVIKTVATRNGIARQIGSNSQSITAY